MSRLKMQIAKHLSLKLIPVALAIGLLAGCSEDKSASAQGNVPPPAVSVVTVTSEPVGQYGEFVARTEASETVDLRVRVDGFIEKRNFIEGEQVDKGQLLFLLDQAPFKAALSQAKANLASAEAGQIRTAADLSRGRDLFPQGHISKSNMDTLISNEAQAKASVEGARAKLQEARINLSYTEIHAPFSGLIGKETYSVGSLVGATSQPLATLVKVDPIYVNFQVNEKDLLNYQTKHQGMGLEGINQDFNANLKLPNGSMYAEQGTFDFTDTKVEETTGTVTLRASFPNPDRLLLPGLYVTLVVNSEAKKSMPVIPQATVQENQQGRFVLVVNKDNKVEPRIVTMGRRIGPMWAVDSGLNEGERIIISGLQKVRPGVVVNPLMKTVDHETGTVSDTVSNMASDMAQPSATGSKTAGKHNSGDNTKAE